MPPLFSLFPFAVELVQINIVDVITRVNAGPIFTIVPLTVYKYKWGEQAYVDGFAILVRNFQINAVAHICFLAVVFSVYYDIIQQTDKLYLLFVGQLIAGYSVFYGNVVDLVRREIGEGCFEAVLIYDGNHTNHCSYS